MLLPSQYLVHAAVRPPGVGLVLPQGATLTLPRTLRCGARTSTRPLANGGMLAVGSALARCLALPPSPRLVITPHHPVAGLLCSYLFDQSQKQPNRGRQVDAPPRDGAHGGAPPPAP